MASRQLRRLVLITPGFPARELDTVSVPALQVYTRQLKATCPELEILVLALHYPRSVATYEIGGVAVEARPAWAPWPLRLLSLRRLVRRIETLHQEQRVDLIHSFWLSDATMTAIWAGGRIQRPVVATVMGQDAQPSNRYLRVLSLDKTTLVAPADRTARYLRSSLAASFRRVGAAEIQVVPWGVEPSLGADQAGERDIDLLSVGSLTCNKNYTCLLDMVRRLVDEGRSIRCVLVGDGEQRGQLEQQRVDLGLEGTVEFLGERPRAEVLSLMARSKVFVHPALYEGFGLVFAEALHSGMSIVSRNVGAAREAPYWRLFEKPSELAALVVAALDEPQPCAQPIFPIERTVSAYVDLYRSLVEQG